MRSHKIEVSLSFVEGALVVPLALELKLTGNIPTQEIRMEGGPPHVKT